MKAIQITLDDRLLARLDADPDVRRLGRSAIFRQATEAWLAHRKKRAITDAYHQAYGRRPRRNELDDWADEGVWPEP